MQYTTRSICLTIAMLLSVAITHGFEVDAIPTTEGEAEVTFIGHGTLMISYGETVIQIDPWTRLADYATLPKADLILITHAHGDHADPEAVAATRKKGTVIIGDAAGIDKVGAGEVMANGDHRTAGSIEIEAVPAYNIEHKRSSGEPFHPKGRDNGYVITIDGTRFYIAGDTENTPEMKALKNIDVAFLPMNLPYTMTPEMVADAAKAFKPKILYPYHFGDTDPTLLVKLLEGETIDVRVRSMK
ncbi:MAG: MBL fold metallo-hydrolase [bacterium]|nr:MBL fold metallo-hydrolase [bacterium]